MCRILSTHLHVPKPVYPEFMPPEDEVLPAEEQPLPTALLPTFDLPGYDPADYLVDGGDDGDDEDESSDDDEDDDVDIEGDEDEEEHPPPTYSIDVALPAVDQAPSAEETEPFETNESAATPPPHPAYRVTTRISIRDEPTTPFWSDTEVARLLDIPTPSPSPLSPWSSPLPQIPSPPLPPILSPLPVSQPLPVSSLPPASHIRIALGPRYEVGESSSATTAKPTRGSRADYGFVATLDREIRRDPERYVDYGITDTWDEMLEDMPAAPATDDTELGRWMTEFATRVRQDTDEIYMRLDDEQTKRQLMAIRLNMLYRDRRAHARKGLLMEREARISRKAWG
ncbi:hypothetical protein Tco_0887184 [Tanacetum coccineum]